MPVTAKLPRSSNRTRANWQVPLLVAIAVWGISQFLPLASPLIVALVVGAVVANTSLADTSRIRGAASPAKFMLRVGVALLGLRLAVSDITQLGLFGVLLVILTVGITFHVTRFVGNRMGLEPEFVSLMASGFAVCGAAAIAAVQDSVKAKENLVALALALVTIHGTLILAVIPLLGELFSLDDKTTAVWAGASIHEVAQVAAAAALIGPGALAIAMGVKLGRVLMLVPVHYAVSRLHHTGRGSLLREIPWFLYAFVTAVLLRATGLLPEQAIAAASHSSTILLAAGMFGLGLGIVLKDLWPIPGRAVALSGVATLTVTSAPLLMLLASGVS
jgi:uncharacterized integral membrane protein (TIGR00698 family)